MNGLQWLDRRHKLVFYGLWLVMNLVQAAGTGLLDDEAYYWVYSRFPDWGYFDHPPMIALMIRAGTWLFSGELGVRMLIVLSSTATLAAIDSLLEQRNDRLFYAIALSMALLQMGGILAAPDLPLMLFIGLFFLAYRSFTLNASLKNTLLLGLVCAAMLYSKYHGILVIFFTILSNPGLLKKWQTWLAGLVGLALFFPHLHWQYIHDFPSVRYHLFERNATDYQFEFTLEYVLGQVLLAGPLIGWLLIWAAWKHRPASPTERAMKWSFIGIYALFFMATLKGRSEANWTIPAWIGMIVLAHQYLHADPQKAAWVYKLLIPSLALVMAARVYLLLDIPPSPLIKKDEFHKNKEWAMAIRDKADGLPVVFTNSYQKASQYWFYSGDTAFSLNNVWYRRSNYNAWPLEARSFGKPTAIFSGDNYVFFKDTVKNTRRIIGAAKVDSFYSFSQLSFSGGEKVLGRLPASGQESGNLSAQRRQVDTTLQMHVPDGLLKLAAFHRFDTAAVYLVLYFHDNDPALIIPTGSKVRDGLGGSMRVRFWLPDTLTKGSYRARWAIGNPVPGRPSINSSASRLIME
jgi:hypothetical protein